VPDVTLRTTFIVGFPGETDADVDALAEFVEHSRFDHVGVFTYSHEEDTRAFVMNDDVPADVKQIRRDRIMRLQRRIARNLRQSQVGSTVAVMVDGPSPESELVVTGRLAGQAPDIDSQVIFTECDPSMLAPGAIVNARVLAARGYDLVVSPLPA